MSVLNIAILGYRSDSYGTWDPDDVHNGIPGSEECAVYASNNLAQRGHKVTVYMNPPSGSLHSLESANPRWISVDEWSQGKEKYDLVLMWRRYDADTGRLRGDKVFFWPHDSPFNQGNFRFPNFDGVCPLSEHHRSQFKRFPGFDNIPYTICGNGLVAEQFQQPNQSTNPLSLGYFSNYARGLDILLFLWPVIRKKFPTATLDIYYGRDSWGLLSPTKLQGMVDAIEKYRTEGVTEHGKVGHEALAKAMHQTSIWAYPCNEYGIAETFCITAVKCQAAGCIPVTTRIGALRETVHPEAYTVDHISSPLHIFQYRDLLFSVMEQVAAGNIDREKYVTFGRQFTWDRVVNAWLELYEKVK